MNKLRQLITEIHRRSIWQVLGVYVVGAWVGYEVVLSLTEGLGLPEWVPPVALILFIIGLPIVLATAMVEEGLPGSAGASAQPDDSPATVAESTADPAPPPTSAPMSDARRLFTWPRAITAGVLAFALLGLAAAGFLGMRALGIGPAATLFSSGALEAGQPIVLADFAGPPEVARVVTEAVRVDLAASPIVRILPADRVTDALRRMRREPDVPLDRADARELAIREGLGAVIAGEVAPLAASYVLTAEVVAADNGEVLASFRETARDSTELIDAIDALSASMRGKIGESLRSVRSSAPLAAYTTSSLEALRRYAEGARLSRNGRTLESIRAYEEAVRLDPDFAMAWRKIGIEYGNLGVNRARRDEALRRAYELADRLPDREQGLAAGSYHLQVTEDRDSAMMALRSVADRYDDDIAWNNMALLLNQRGEWEAAAEAARQAMEAAPGPTNYANLLVALYGLGRMDEFRTLLTEGRQRFPANPGTFAAWLARPAADGEYAEALARTDSIIARHGDAPVVRGRTLLARADIFEIQGRVAEALEAYDEVTEITRQVGLRPERLLVATRAAQTLAWIARDPAAARARIEDGLAAIPLAGLEADSRPLVRIAQVRALLGDTAGAADLLAAWDSTSAGRARPRAAASARGWLALATDRPRDAIDAFQEAARQCPTCGLAQLGIAYRRAGMPDSARAALERYLAVPALFRWETDADYLAPALEMLAELSEEAGDMEAAARYYGRFIELWQHADPPLQGRVEAARERLAGIVARQG